ncbi:hypothetical protein GOP47_0009714 [Adiantum capillus-veneris]|uniref:Cytochrome P450 n=1 Tax=Adiantum capillus-veneris TaxID=13818 RepID=A0A9D4ZHE7_ADICA|nr:hypothetical protein GOP47_0009714 [Adiantum capillus-veneris]
MENMGAVLRPPLEYGGSAVQVVAAALVILTIMLYCMASQTVLKRSKVAKLPPGPWGFPLIGNLLELLGGDLPHIAMARLSRKFGPIVFLKLGKAPTVLVSDSTLARACLTSATDKIFASRPPMEATRRLQFGNCAGIIMTPYSDEWRQARKLCSLQLFTARRVSEFEPIRRDEIVVMMGKIKQQAGEIVNLTEALSSLTEGMTCKMLLGKPLEEINAVDEGGVSINMKMLVQRGTQLFQIPIIGDFIPALGFLDRSNKVALDEVHNGFDIIFSKLIQERQQSAAMPLKAGSPQVILDVLLHNVDIDRVKNIMMDLITASIDTSATVLDWAMAELLGCPQAMARLQAELDEVAKGEDRLIEEAELGDLVYLKAVVKETMRLHAPVPLLIPHLSTEECIVGGYRVPKGTRLLINAWAIGRDARSWPEEPDRFKPERFLSGQGATIDFCGQHFELLPFGSGRRICPGMSLAIPLVESALANLVYNFSWHLPLGHSLDLSERFAVVVCRAHPLLAIPHLRHKMIKV